MEWWNDLWLNEGFAKFMEFVSVSVTHPELKVVSCIYLLSFFFFFFLHFRLICCWKIVCLPMLDYGIYRKIDNLPGSLNMDQVSKMLVYFKGISQRLLSTLSCLFPNL